MRHVLSALVQNQPGVLAHISGMLASRGFNIDSLAVGETEDANLSRMTFVVHGDDAELEQVRKQLDKIVTVVKVQDISSEDFVERDLMLIKVKAVPPQRMEISLLVEMFRGRVVDISADTLMIEISGQERKIEAFIELMRPYGILELARTGRIALVRGRPGEGDIAYDAAAALVSSTRPIARSCPSCSAASSPVSASASPSGARRQHRDLDGHRGRRLPRRQLPRHRPGHRPRAGGRHRRRRGPLHQGQRRAVQRHAGREHQNRDGGLDPSQRRAARRQPAGELTPAG